ncbi:hypothetical protein ACTFIY_001594 [Dictyostelium cf. discoideum]
MPDSSVGMFSLKSYTANIRVCSSYTISGVGFSVYADPPIDPSSSSNSLNSMVFKINSSDFKQSKIEMIKFNNNSIQFYFLINFNQIYNNSNNISKIMISISNKYCKINEHSDYEIKCFYNMINDNDIAIFKIDKNQQVLQPQTKIKNLEIDCQFLEEDFNCNNKIELLFTEQNSNNNSDSSTNINSSGSISSDQNDEDPGTGIIVIVIVVSIVGLIIIGGLGTFIFLKYFLKRFQQNITNDIEINDKNLKSINASISEN